MWTYRHTQTGFYEHPSIGEYSSDFYESLPVNDGSEKDKNPSRLVSVLGNILEQEGKRGKELSEERLRLITKLDDLQNEISLLIENYGGEVLSVVAYLSFYGVNRQKKREETP